jgi:chaperone BCS1
MGKTWFWYNGNLIRVYRKKESIVATSGWGGIKDQEEIKISCMGRSTGKNTTETTRQDPQLTLRVLEPLKRLLASAKELYYNDNRQKTSIYRPEFRDRGFNHVMWKQLVRRPVRPMRTVMLAKQDKHTVLEDMNEFLHPSAPAWYAIRGIPLRRGYLFHGPPGTGKTSFSFALAGTFGLDMYVINLQDVNVTDASLLELFTKLPRRCVFLLEDIDTAGLRRDEGSGDDDDDGDEEEEEEAGSDKNEASQMRNKQAVTKAGGKTETHNLKETRNKNQGTDNGVHVDKNKHGSERQRRNTPKGAARNQTKKVGGKSPSSENLSLAGLLNAIDGVATHEGRVLIMTTNKPESLDKALIRPGRMDIQVKFKNASSQQARELFCRMYEADAPPRPTKQVPENVKASKDEKQGGASEMMTARCRGPELAPEELKRMAAEFGDKIPEGLFSPADIQGFLLYRMADPQKALDDAESWIEGFIKQKESGSKVRTVQ